MANQEHLDILKQGVDVWNKWRKEYPDIEPDLSESVLRRNDLRRANLRKANLYRVDLCNAYLYSTDLTEANLMAANLYQADLTGAYLIKGNLTGACINSANLFGADFTEAKLSGANLNMANLSEANFQRSDLRGAIINAATLSNTDLSHADLSGAYLEDVSLVQTNLKEANLTDCSIYGISAWKVQLDGAIQSNLIITPAHEPTITVDNLKVAQFIYLLLDNQEIHEAIDTIAKKAVLILGRFTPERKSILEAIRTALRVQGYLPILFDFQKPDSQDLTGTVSTLANISRFIIVDLTDPSCSPYEIGLIAPCMKPIKPLFQPSKAAKHEFAMFQDLRERFSWVLSIHHYKDQESLLASMQEKVIVPAEKKVQMLEKKKRR